MGVCFKMEYDDFSLSENFERMASEYYKALNSKGFVFMRFDDLQNEKLKLLTKTIQQLAYFEAMLTSLKRYQSKKIFDLKKLTEFQKNDLSKMYNITLPKTKQNLDFPSLENIISFEAKIIKSYFELLELEDDNAKHITIKNMLSSRLDILAN